MSCCEYHTTVCVCVFMQYVGFLGLIDAMPAIIDMISFVQLI